MPWTTGPLQSHHRSLVAFVLLALAAAFATALLARWDPGVFQPYFGRLPPLPVLAIVVAVGGVALRLLYLRAGLLVVNPACGLRGLGFALAIAPAFLVPVIALDWIVGFPEEINVLAPASLLFYPTIGFVVEIAFHALPVAVLLVALGVVFPSWSASRSMFAAMALAGTIEPVFQVWFGFVADAPLWFHTALALHLLAFNWVQMFVFRRYDFVSMYFFRLVYYVLWHMVWGEWRLYLLF